MEAMNWPECIFYSVLAFCVLKFVIFLINKI